MGSRLREYADRHGILTMILNLSRVLKGYQPIFLDYPVEAIPRYGHGKPSHPELAAMFAAEKPAFLDLLREFAGYEKELAEIPLQPSSPIAPHWQNQWFLALDLIALYGFLRRFNPAQFVEIGSGQSTKIARLAIGRGLKTRIRSIDPHPRAEIDALCDEVIRQPLEKVDPATFQQLGPGDMLFFDGSHRVFMNSDVTVFFLEVLPRLSPGVFVHIHDIFLPDDYQPWWKLAFYPHRYWSEQYMLAASLLAGHSNYDIILPNYYMSTLPECKELLRPLCTSAHLDPDALQGSSFWIVTK